MWVRTILGICLGWGCANPLFAQVGTSPEPSSEATAMRDVDALFDANLIPAFAGEDEEAAERPGRCLDAPCDGVPLPERPEAYSPSEPLAPSEPGSPRVTQPAPQSTRGEITMIASRGRTPAMIGDAFGPLGGLQAFASTPLTAFAAQTASDRLTATSAGGGLHFFQLPNDQSLSEAFANGRIEGLQARGNPADGSPRLPGTFTAIPTGQTDQNGLPLFRVVANADLVVPSVLSGSFNIGQLKFAESGTVLPMDRVIFNYHYFDNVPLFAGGVNVHRFVPGFEKTFFDGTSSVEVRFPFSSTLDSQIDAFGTTNARNVEFGNVRITPKVLLGTTRTTAVSAGLGIVVPTADDISFQVFDAEYLGIENESVHLAPYIGWLYTPTPRFFSQAILQFDFDTNGSPVRVNDDPFGLVPNAGPRTVGRLQDPTFLYLDWQIGYWLRNRSGQFVESMTGLAAVAELHWNRSLQSTDTIDTQFAGFPTRIGRELETIESINLTLGLVGEFHRSTYLTLGYSVPLAGGEDQMFDGELRAFFTHRFGPATRFRRTAFGL